MATTFRTLADREKFNRRRREEYAQDKERITELRRLSDGKLRRKRTLARDKPYFVLTESNRLAISTEWATTEWRIM